MKINNPFVVAGKIPHELFCDRKKESQLLTRAVTNGNNVVLVSARRMGKTGLIQYCFEKPEIKDYYATFYIDILQTSSLKEFTYLFGKAVFQRLASTSQRRLKQFAAILHSISGSFGFDPFNGTPTFNLQLGEISNPALTLDEIFRFLADSDTPSIIAIDEFQQISNYQEKNVEAMLRSYIQQLPNANFVFAGSERHLLQQMFSDSARPFFNSASFMELNPIQLPEYTEFATDLFQKNDKRLEPEVVAKVYNLFEGNTFYLQKTFNIAYSKTGKDQACDAATVEESVNEILASFDTIYREMLSNVAESQKQLLIAISQEGNAEGITSARFIKKYSLASASSVQAAARKLLALGFIVRNDNTYRIQDPLLRIWLLRTYTSIPI